MPTKLFRLIEVETTNYCNRKCWYCIHGQQPVESRIKMSDELIAKIIRELGALRYDGKLNWFSANEPLLDPRIFDILKQTRRHVPRCDTRLFTNGDLLTQEILERLFKCGLSYLRITAHSQETWRKVKALKLDGFNALPVPFWLRSPDSLNNRAGTVKPLAKDTRFLDWTCPRPMRFMVIRADGQLKLCAEDLAGVTFNASLNCRERSLKDLWFSEEMEHYRVRLKEGRRAELKTCCDCNFCGRAFDAWCRPTSE